MILATVAIWVTVVSIGEVFKENKTLQQVKQKQDQQIRDLKKEKDQIQKDKDTQMQQKLQDIDNQIKALQQARADKKATLARAVDGQPAQVRIASAHYEAPENNENIVWDFLIKQGFTRNQTAGIMGNLQQEHGFQTSGDGLAQWMGGRKERLMSMANPYSLQTQLQFLMIELNEGCGDSIKATNDVVQATLIFQNNFERCGNCMQVNRIRYANDILRRH